MYHPGALAFLIFPALLLLWSSPGRLARSIWPALVVAVTFGAAQVREALANLRAPREWDFGCFWLYAHVAQKHENLYDPRVFAAFRVPFPTDADFAQAVIAVGFPYPPPSIALYLPLAGSAGLARGLALWYVAQFAALAIAAFALQRAFFPRDGLRGAVLVAALALLLPALSSNTSQAQTNVFLLALLAVAFLARERSGGAWSSALAIWIKPYVATLILTDLAARRFGRVAVALLAVAISLAASIALVGPAAFLTYLRSNPALREPAAAFTESVNQSLLAVILRATHPRLGAHVAPLHEPLYLATAAGLGAVTFFLCARYRKASDVSFCAGLLLGLLIYPGTLEAYGTIALLPLLVLWSRRTSLPLGTAAVATLAGAVILLQGPLHAGFAANAALWLATALTLPLTKSRDRPIATA